jgi:WD40 repeat protein
MRLGSITVAASSADSISSTDTTQPRAPLSFEFSVKLPDYPSQVAWSRDGKRLAVSQFNTGKVRFIDLESRQILETVLEASGDPKMVWSPNDKYLALNDGGKANGLRIFETATWKELGHKSRLTGECIFQDGPAFGFSKDGKYLWASCYKRQSEPQPNQDSYKALLKLNVPDLSVAAVVDRPLPVPLDFAAVSNDYAVSTPTGTSLSTIVSSRFDGRDQLGAPILRTFATISELDSESVVGPTVEFQDDKNFQKFATRVLQWPERNAMIAFWGWPDHPLQKDATVPDKYTLPRLETYDTRTGQRLVAFAPTTEHRIPLHDVVLSRKASLVFGALSSTEPNAGALVAWDPMSGKQIQLVPTVNQAAWLWLSHDETRLAVIALRDILIFRVN